MKALNKKLRTLKDSSGTNMDDEGWVKSYQSLIDCGTDILKELGEFHNKVAENLIDAGLVQKLNVKKDKS